MSETIRLTVTGADGENDGADLAGVEELSDWRRMESELAGRVREVHAPPVEGQLGALSDGLEIVLLVLGSVLLARTPKQCAREGTTRKETVSYGLVRRNGRHSQKLHLLHASTTAKEQCPWCPSRPAPAFP